jgi:hypothetical protein
MLRVASVKMRRGGWIGWLGTGLLVGLAVACSINPQPLPPDQYTGDEGAGDASAGATTPGNGGTTEADGGVALADSDGGASMPPGTEADASTTDGGTEPDGGDAGDAGDAGQGDAEPDASPDAG